MVVLTRNEVVIELPGDDGRGPCRRAPPWATAISTTTTPCSSPMTRLRCESRQVFKKVLKNGAVGRVPGQDPGQARRAEDRWLPDQPVAAAGRGQPVPGQARTGNLRRRREMPHGSTSGAIDETALFYLRSRGVPQRAGAVAAGAGLPGRGDRRDRRRGASPRTSGSGWKAGWPGTRAEMPITTDIVRQLAPTRARSCAASWRAAEHEGRALAVLMGGLPADLRRAMARCSRARPISTRRCRSTRGMGGALMACCSSLPLIAYGVAGAQPSGRAGLRRAGARGYGARMALFWSLLAVSPLMLLQGLVRGLHRPRAGADRGRACWCWRGLPVLWAERADRGGAR